MIKLKEIDPKNFDEVINLSVHDEQKSFVAGNLFSLAQAGVFPSCVPRAIYDDDTLVGFFMYGLDDDDNEYWVSRLMIDKNFQNRGYGLTAMNLLIEELRLKEDCKRLFISFEPENDGAKSLYEKLGFTPDGRILDGEIVYCLSFE